MKDKFKNFFRKLKRIFKKIIKDRQLLGILILCLVVLVVGFLIIGFKKMLLIILALIVIGIIAKLVIDKKMKKEVIETEEVDMAKRKKKKNKRVFSTILNIVLIFILVCIILGILFIGYIAISAPNFNPSNLYRKESSIVYGNDDKTVVAKLGSEIRDTITYDDMPQVLIDAIIATEDSRFYQHGGVDFARFLKASVGQLLGNSGAGGGSTITMQVSKKAYTSDVADGIRGIIRKFTDIYISLFKLEKNYTKEQILEYYVNIPFLGSHSFGVSEASHTYFGKEVGDLNLSEAALLAGLFQAPTAYDPYNHPEAAGERRAVVLRLMKRHGYITQEEEEMANSISVESLLGTKNYSNPYQNFIDVVLDEIYDKTGENPYNTPMKIYTTLDTKKQDHLNSIINGESYTWVNDMVQTGIAVTDVNTGALLAISGGRNTVALGLNRATDLNNQPGSTAKPLFDYAPGVEYNNWSTYTPFIDQSWSYSNGVGIKNWDGSFYGFLTLKNSLGLSRNIPALKAFQNVSNKNLYKFITSLGLTPESTDGSVHEAHALGAFNGTSPLEMAVAYAAFANGGYYIEPYTVTKIVYLDTNQTKEYKPSKTKVMADSTAYIVTNSLVWAVDSGLSNGVKIYGQQVAAKTGTTNFDDATISSSGMGWDAVKDYWVVGYTPSISIGLWYGYDKIHPDYYNTVADNNRKDRLFRTVMSGMLDDNTRSFNVPNSIAAVEVEKGSLPAMLPSANTPKELITTEYFKVGTEPTNVSPRYQTLNNPNNLNVTITNKVATLTWNAVSVPEYFTEKFMDTYYKNGMGDFPSNYKKYQLEQFKKLGDFGYDIYIVDSTGNEKYLTTTTTTSATVNVSAYTGDVKFIVRTAWANEKISISSGSEYTISTSDVSLVDVSLNGDNMIELKVGDSYTENITPITVLDNFANVTNKATISRTITNSKNETLTAVDTTTPDTYTIKYKIIYKGSTYQKIRTIKVVENTDTDTD